AVEEDEGELTRRQRIETLGRHVYAQASRDKGRQAALGATRRVATRIIQTAADVVARAVLAKDAMSIRRKVMVTEPHAEALREAVVRLDDTGLDHDLPHCNVDLRDEPAHLLEPARHVLHEEHVRARI